MFLASIHFNTDQTDFKPMTPVLMKNISTLLTAYYCDSCPFGEKILYQQFLDFFFQFSFFPYPSIFSLKYFDFQLHKHVYVYITVYTIHHILSISEVSMSLYFNAKSMKNKKLLLLINFIWIESYITCSTRHITLVTLVFDISLLDGFQLFFLWKIGDTWSSAWMIKLFANITNWNNCTFRIALQHLGQIISWNNKITKRKPEIEYTEKQYSGTKKSWNTNFQNNENHGGKTTILRIEKSNNCVILRRHCAWSCGGNVNHNENPHDYSPNWETDEFVQNFPRKTWVVIFLPENDYALLVWR